MGAEERTFAMPDATWNVVESSLPNAGTVVKYRTSAYQMLGYRNQAGNWVALDGREETRPVKAWRMVYQPVAWPERAF